MRVRKHGIAAVVVAAVALVTISGTSVARAQGASPSVKPAEGAPAPSASSVVADVGAGVGAHLFSPPAVLDQAWARAVEAVLEGMKRLVDTERLEAVQALAGPSTPPIAPARFTHGGPPLRYVPAWRAAWAPGKAVRDALAAAPVQPKPLPVEPPSEAGVDTRGEHAVLLGVTMELPWRVP